MPAEATGAATSSNAHNWARLTEQVKAEASRLGFDLVGVTTPDPPPHMDVYEHWLEQGRHGDMAYLDTRRARSRRADPRRILPECQSILVVAANYLPPRPHAADAEAAAKVAAYAQGDDYHDVLLERLERLVKFIERSVGGSVPNRMYTDTGPLLERELAQRAGLGWIGKNTCLIHPSLGSYFLLAEVLLGIPLVPDQPIRTDHCGTCTRCLEACPTACILPDRTIDATRCISYLTIEIKGSIPANLRSLMGDWVFGCDICQEVCPWNVRFAAPTDDPAFLPRPVLREPAPAAFLTLDTSRYQETLRGSPLKRAKRNGLQRNAAVAAGNRGDPSDVPYLIQVLREEGDPMPREHAAWALGRIGGEAARQALADAAGREENEQVRAEIARALEESSNG